MVKRKRIGLIFSYNENWIAGAYYIMNIIHSLNTLPDKDKPIITILSESIGNFDIVKNETAYPYLKFFKIPLEIKKYSILNRIINKITLKFFNYKIIKKGHIQPRLDFVYPSILKKFNYSKVKKTYWIPDFQEDYLPHFFSEEEVIERKTFQKNVVCNCDLVVFSSVDSQNDFNRLYPNAKPNQFVLNFAVVHPNISEQIIEKLLEKYTLPQQYFFSPNQFWAHKNHAIILKAIKLLKNKGVDVCIAFSGKENDYRNTENFETLKLFIKENNLEDNIKFLGFIPREEQLSLMKNSVAIIQPSLFEGWSTVVEDAIALNKFIILSNLKVHKEQIDKNVCFFDRNNEKELAIIIEKYLKNSPIITPINYKKNIEDFANSFIKLINL